MKKFMNTVLVILFMALFSISLQSCGQFKDFLTNYKGSLVSPTAGDMIYLESAGDTFLFGKPSGSHNIQATLTYNFLISRYEISNKAFGEFVHDGGYTNQSYWTTDGWNYINSIELPWPNWWLDLVTTPEQPVVGLSWYEAVAFTQWLSIKEGWPVSYDSDGRIIDIFNDGYRLPTEVEWEYAASKGDPTATERIYAWGNSWNCGNAVCRVPPCDNYVSYLQSIGSKSPVGDTPRGLSDMGGNASEMVSDTYQDPIPNILPLVNHYNYDPQELNIIHRGGGWKGNSAGVFETSHREYITKRDRWKSHVGFRIVRTYPIQ